MSLFRYYVDFSNVPVEQREELIKKLDDIGYTSFHINPVEHCGEFVLESTNKPEDLINIPTGCIIRRIS